MRRAVAMLVLCSSPTLAAFPCRAEEPPTPVVYWIGLEHGDSLEARAVEFAWSDFVRYRRPDGSVHYVPANRIAHIYAEGADVRDRVLKDHQALPGSGTFGPTPRYRSLAFRGGDRSHCSSFLLTEAGVFVPITKPPGVGSRDQNLFGSVDLGWMKNVGSRSGIGASAFWESGSDHNRGGVRVRYRRWLGGRFSVELSPGIVLKGNDTYDAPGVIGQASLNAGDLMSLVIEGEYERYRWQYWYWNGSTTVPGPLQQSSDTSLRVGLRAGSYLGAGSMVLAGIALAALAASFQGGYL